MDDTRVGPVNDILFQKADAFAQAVYELTYTFPREELFGITSQIRRAVLSVPLNITEGYARRSDQDHRRFLDIAYGSLKEVKYLLYFCKKRKIISDSVYEKLMNIAEELSKILWRKISTIRAKTAK